MMSTLVSLDDIREAAARIRGVARETPLLELSLDDHPAAYVKCENLQRGGAFKIRGAYNMIRQLSADQLHRGVITYSSGNHGLAVSYAARLVGAPAVIVMPTTAPAIKSEGARQLGAEVIFEGTTSMHRKARAEAEAASRGLTIVPPFDHAHIIAGQGTIGIEVLAGCEDVEEVLVQIGGGGLVSGIAAAIKQSRPAVRVVGVEPTGAPKMSRSLAAGQPVTLDRSEGVTDGLLPVRPGDLTFAHVRAFVDEVITIDDRQTIAAVRWLFQHAKLVVEPSGAITVAALFERRAAGHKSVSVAVLSGGNVAPEAFARYIQAVEPVS